jgi:hypothetical protein
MAPPAPGLGRPAVLRPPRPEDQGPSVLGPRGGGARSQQNRREVDEGIVRSPWKRGACSDTPLVHPSLMSTPPLGPRTEGPHTWAEGSRTHSRGQRTRVSNIKVPTIGKHPVSLWRICGPSYLQPTPRWYLEMPLGRSLPLNSTVCWKLLRAYYTRY